MSYTSPAIEIKQLIKSFRGFHALDQITLSIPEASMFGLLGPNGAGKTTLLRTLLGFIKTSSGTASIFGNPIGIDTLSVRRLTAYLPAEAKLFRMMRGSAVLKLFSELHPSGNYEASKRVAERLDLDTSRMVGFMSTGMRQKLAIAVVLGVQARLVILDEPTANLDPTVRMEVLKLIRETHERGATIVFSSHLLDEIEELCDRAAIIRAGKVVQEVDLHELRLTYLVTVSQVPATLSQNLPVGCSIDRNFDGKATVRVESSTTPLNDALRKLVQQDIVVEHVEPLGLRTIYESCSKSY